MVKDEKYINESNSSKDVQNNSSDYNNNHELHISDNSIQNANIKRNFKYLDNLIHSGSKEIVLDSDIVLNDDEESEYKDGIKLDVNELIIDGNGFKVDAKGKTRIFQYTEENITIKNIILKNGFARFGGAIRNRGGELTIIGATFTGNTAQSQGGAIYNKAKLKINDSTFTGNTAQEKGGAIRNSGAELTITDSTFYENTARRMGGAISGGGELTIIGVTFTGNTAEIIFPFSTPPLYRYYLGGGAIYIMDGVLKIRDSTFTGNRACGKDVDGAAILLVNSEYESENCTFKDNKQGDVFEGSTEGEIHSGILWQLF